MSTVRISKSHIAGNISVSVPGSKSVANRALMIAALSNGSSTISNLPDGDDTEAMLKALSELGVTIEHVDKDTVTVTGPVQPLEACEVNAHLAGTTSRFLLAMCCLSSVPVTVTGEAPLLARPVGDLVHALRTIGFAVSPEASSSLPLTVSSGGELSEVKNAVTIRGDISSQFISALMMIGPVLPRGLVISIEGELVSRSYVEMTANVMSAFGATVEIRESEVIIGAQSYTPINFAVEPDYSSAAFPIVGAVLAGCSVRIPGLMHSRLQGDVRILEIAEAMGAYVLSEKDDVIVGRKKTTPIRPITTNMSDCSDLVPVVATLASFADGPSELTGIGFIRAKESDRLGDLATELRKTGTQIEVLEDGLRILPSSMRYGASLETHHDHRLAMSFALLGLMIPGIEILNHNVVSKSWPSYWVAMEVFFSSRVPRRATVAFDLDKTLTIRDCVLPFFMRVMGRRHLASLFMRNVHHVIRYIVKRDRDGLKEFSVRLIFAGRSVGDVRALGDDFAQHIVNHWMRSDTCAVMKWHQQQGDDLVLVTASLSPYVKPLAASMGISSVLCSELVIDGSEFTGELAEGNCRGAEKARRLAQWLQNRHLDYAYGDSAGDDAMLALATTAVRVGRRDVVMASSVQ